MKKSLLFLMIFGVVSLFSFSFAAAQKNEVAPSTQMLQQMIEKAREAAPPPPPAPAPAKAPPSAPTTPTVTSTPTPPPSRAQTIFNAIKSVPQQILKIIIDPFIAPAEPVPTPVQRPSPPFITFSPSPRITQGETFTISWGSPTSGVTSFPFTTNLPSPYTSGTFYSPQTSQEIPGTVTSGWASGNYSISMRACVTSDNCSGPTSMNFTIVARPQEPPRVVRFGIDGSNGNATVSSLQDFSLGWQIENASSAEITIPCLLPNGISPYGISCGPFPRGGQTNSIGPMSFRNDLNERVGVPITITVGSYSREIIISVNPPPPRDYNLRFESASGLSQVVRGQDAFLSWSANNAGFAQVILNWAGDERPDEVFRLPNQDPQGRSFVTGNRINGSWTYLGTVTREWPEGTHWIRIRFCNSERQEVCRDTPDHIAVVRSPSRPRITAFRMQNSNAIIGESFWVRWATAELITSASILYDFGADGSFDYREKLSSSQIASRERTYTREETGQWREGPARISLEVCNAADCTELPSDQVLTVNVNRPERIYPRPTIEFFVPDATPSETQDSSLRTYQRPRNTIALLQWRSSDAVSCVGLGGVGSWPGPRSLAGNWTMFDPLIETRSFVLQCQGPGGTVEKIIRLTPVETATPPPRPSESATRTTGQPTLTVEPAEQIESTLFFQGHTLIFTKVRFTASADSDITVNSLVVERGGPSDDAIFAGIILLDENGRRVGNMAILNTAHQANLSEPFVIRAGESRVISIAGIAADSLDRHAGRPSSLRLIRVNTSATVTGASLPTTGVTHTASAGRPEEGPQVPATEERSVSYDRVAGVSFEGRGTLDYGNFVQGQYQNINLTATFLPYIFNTTNPFPERLAVDYEVRLVRREGGRDTPLPFMERRGFDYENIYGSRGRPPLVTTVPVFNLEPGSYVLRTTFTILDENGRLARIIPSHTGGNFVMPVLETPFTIVSRERAIGQAQPPPPASTPPPSPGEEVSLEITTEEPSIILSINGEYGRVSVPFGTVATLSWRLVNVDSESCTGINWPASLPPSRNIGSAAIGDIQPSTYRYVLTCRDADGRDTNGNVELQIRAPGERLVEFGEDLETPIGEFPAAQDEEGAPTATTRILSEVEIRGQDDCATENQITLTWNYSPPTGSNRTPAAYEVQIANNRSFASEDILVIQQGGPDASAIINYNFRTGTTYYWRLRIKERLADDTITQWSRWSNDRGIRFGEIGTQPQLISPSSFTCGS